MKTFAITFTLLVLALAVQDAYGRPPRGSRPEGRSNQGRPGQGLPSQGPPAQAQNQGKPEGVDGKGPGKKGPKAPPCLVKNVTTGEELCNVNCPAFADCVMPSLDARHPQPEGLEIHICLPKACEENSNTCANGSACRPVNQTAGEFRCLPDRKNHARPHKSSKSSESSEESSESVESSEESEEFSKEERSEFCFETLKEILKREHPEGGHPEGDRAEGDRRQGGRPEGDHAEGGRRQGGRPEGDRAEGGRRQGGRPEGGRPEGGRPQGGRPQGGRPQGGEIPQTP